MKEIWKPIPGYKNYYASNLGNIKRVYNNKVKVLKPIITTRGYYVVNFYVDYLKYKLRLVHRLVYSAFNPTCKIDDLVIDHLDTNRLNNNISNLRLCTQRDNVHNELSMQNHRKAVQQIVPSISCTNTNDNIHLIFNSINEAAEHLPMCDSTICKYLKNGMSYKGWTFEYVQ